MYDAEDQAALMKEAEAVAYLNKIGSSSYRNFRTPLFSFWGFGDVLF